jgi:HSP20 family protein
VISIKAIAALLPKLLGRSRAHGQLQQKEFAMAQEIKKPETTGTGMPRYRDPFAEMRAEMDRVFDSFLGRSFFGRPSLPRLPATETISPNVDVRENEREVVFEAELPGIDEKDVTVILRDGILSLKGEKKSEREEKKDAYPLVERSYGEFERSFQLPDTIDENQVKANFDKGVLRIVVPKRPEAARAERKIPIGKS